MLLLTALTSCAIQPEFITEEELGCEFPDVELNASEGSHSFDIISNTVWTAALDDADWVELASDPSSRSIMVQGDGRIDLNIKANSAEERKAVITVTTKSRKIELVLIQNNAVEEHFSFPQRNVLIGFENGTHSVPFVYNVPAEEISYSVEYEDEEGWIEEPVPGVIGDEFVFAASENISDARRGAIITLTASDKAGRQMSATLNVSQMASTESETIPVSVQDVRNFSVDDLDGDGCIRKNYVLTARVINDNSEGNGAPNSNTSIIMQDLTLSSRTLYLQSLEKDSEGNYCGIRLEFAGAKDNSTRRYDLLEINLKGLKYHKDGAEGSDDPFRVGLSGASTVNIISTTAGSASDLPLIERTINTLKDSDIYTFVKLLDCELPIRKGPFVPVDLRYQNIINKYPMVLRDADASIMYMVCNTTCSWARDGKGMPQGSGAVSGIIVHERCDNFEWDSEAAAKNTLLNDYITDEGYIGKYQIRPVLRSEIELSDELSDGVSTLMREWRYCNSLYPEKMVVTAVKDTIYPSYPAVATPTDKTLKAYFCYSEGKITTGQDWTHLGPVSGGVITDIPGSNGVYDYNGTNIHWKPLSYCNTCGIIQGENGSSWFGGTWYSGSHTTPSLEKYYWEFAFSTEEYSASNAPLSINLGTSNAYGDDTGAPRYWFLAYSTDKTNWHTVTADSYAGEKWVDLTAKGKDYTYTVPDFPIIASKRQYNLPGNKYISINLPSGADVWGKEQVYVRLYPAKDLSGYNGSAPVSYDGAGIMNNRRSSINYVGIRCRK